MSAPQFGFTKLVVADLEAAEAFYTSVFGLEPTARVTAAIGDRDIDEVMFAPTAPGAGSFVLLRYRDTEGPSGDEVILGMIVDDVEATLDAVVAAGGRVVDPAHAMPEHGVNVGFGADPEGHLLEIVSMLG